MDTISIEKLTQNPGKTVLTKKIAPWLYDASNPYVEWLYGESDSAHRYIIDSLERPSSELSFNRINALILNNGIAGGFIALSGRELLLSRKKDLMHMLLKTKVENRGAIREKIVNAEGLFENISESDYYLSRIGVLPEFRKRGYGQILFNAYLETGKTQGYNRFVLDVFAGNQNAINLYSKHGFKVISKRITKDGFLSYVTMSYKFS